MYRTLTSASSIPFRVWKYCILTTRGSTPDWAYEYSYRYCSISVVNRIAGTILKPPPAQFAKKADETLSPCLHIMVSLAESADIPCQASLSLMKTEYRQGIKEKPGYKLIES